MVFKSFAVQLWLRVGLIFSISTLLGFLIFKIEMYYSSGILFLVLIGLAYDLKNFVGKTNTEIQKFIEALNHNELNLNFPKAVRGKEFNSFYDSINTFLEKQRDFREEQEVHYQFINTIFNHIRTGIIAVDANEKVILINSGAKEILNLPKFDQLAKYKEKVPNLFDISDEDAAKNRNVINLDTGQDFKSISVYQKSILIQSKKYTIFTFQDIDKELGSNELEAWNKLISILTHEIMNSVTPILSLSESVTGLMVNEEQIIKSKDQIDQEDLLDVLTALNTINKRSKGLLKFVEDYRKLSKIPVPDFTKVNLHDLINSIYELWVGALAKEGIKLFKHIPNPKLTLKTDRNQLEQVIINMIINAKDAVKNSAKKEISISAFQDDQNIFITIEDTGSGIPASVQKRIFIPFFTTKTNGSGIGLSLSKQIINLLGGSIKVTTKQDVGTKFYLTF